MSDYWKRRLPPSIDDFETLGRYNAERSRGIVHDPEWVERMAQIQEHFDAEQRARHADGFTRIPARRWWRP